MDDQMGIDKKCTEKSGLPQIQGHQARTRSIRDCWEYEEPMLTLAEPKIECVAVPQTICDTLYTCDICLREFNDNIILKHHIKSVHNFITLDSVAESTVSDSEVAPLGLSNHYELSHNSCNPDRSCSPKNPTSHPIDSSNLPQNSYKPQDPSTMQKRFECDHCSFATVHRKNMVQHLKTKTGMTLYSCKHCSLQFSQRCTLYKHEKKHRQSQRTDPPLTGASYTCRICNKEFRKSASLVTHVSRGRHHMFKCDECPYSSLKMISLARHLNKKHNRSKPYRCHLCDYAALRQSHLNAHLNKHKNGMCTDFKEKSSYSKDSIKRCNFCEYKTTCRPSLIKHLRIHTGEKPYACEHCSRTFAQSGQLKIHLQDAHGLQWQCNVCQFRTVSEAKLANHKLLHDEKRKFVCDQCGLRFKGLPNLKKHVKTHKSTKTKLNAKREPRKYECDFCGHKSKNMTDAMCHVAIHMGKCCFCQFKSANKRTLLKHIKTHSK